ncbi:uncharacterized protein [Mytilus edulis]|uniref:uncharacterized protein n=1 Tax=Mytilus edulis TaxID=6550 RepID=UPI0039F0D405
MKFLLAFFLLGFSCILGDKCVVYEEGETIPSLPTGARYGRTCHSIFRDRNNYCVEWDCPKTDCSDPIVPKTGCPFCNGTCVNGGRVFRDDEHFTCDDGCNGCTCHSTTLMMCYMQEPPELCKGYKEQKRNTLRKIPEE